MKKIITYFIIFITGMFISGMFCQSMYSRAYETNSQLTVVSTIEQMTKDIINESNFFYYSNSPIYTNEEVSYEIYSCDNKYYMVFHDIEMPFFCHTFELHGNNLFYVGKEEANNAVSYANGNFFINGVSVPDYSKYDNCYDTFNYTTMCESICERYQEFAEKKIDVYAVKSFEWDMSLNGGKKVVVSIDDSFYIDTYAMLGSKGYILDKTNYSKPIENNSTYEKLVSNSFGHAVKYIKNDE